MSALQAVLLSFTSGNLRETPTFLLVYERWDSFHVDYRQERGHNLRRTDSRNVQGPANPGLDGFHVILTAAQGQNRRAILKHVKRVISVCTCANVWMNIGSPNCVRVSVPVFVLLGCSFTLSTLIAASVARWRRCCFRSFIFRSSSTCRIRSQEDINKRPAQCLYRVPETQIRFFQLVYQVMSPL